MEQPGNPPARTGTGAAVLGKAMDILRAFDRGRLELTADEVAATVGEAKSTVYRYIKVLTEKGFLERGMGPHTYRPGLVLLRLTRSLRRRLRLTAAALPAMDRLAGLTGETVLLALPYQGQAMCVERRSGPHALQVAFEPGSVFPLTAGAMAKVLLAHLPAVEQAAALAAAAPRPQAAKDREAWRRTLQSELQAIRAGGHARAWAELGDGVGEVAVPVHGPAGDVVAALAVAAPVDRVQPPVADAWLAWLRAAAQETGARLAGGESP